MVRECVRECLRKKRENNNNNDDDDDDDDTDNNDNNDVIECFDIFFNFCYLQPWICRLNRLNIQISKILKVDVCVNIMRK